MPPQYYILSTLADILHGPLNTKEQQDKVRTLSKGTFGRMTINPRPFGKDENGRTILTYEGDETRGGPKGRLHRVLAKFKPGVRVRPNEQALQGFLRIFALKVATDIILIRNFDIFSEIEGQVAEPAKL